MNSDELEYYLYIIKRRCNVVYGDVIPKNWLVINEYPSIYIVNCCNAYLPGIHWTCFVSLNPTSIYFFDSLGKRPSEYGFNVPNAIIVNSRQLQEEDSVACGQFVLYFIYYFLKGSFNISIFTSNQLKNESLVKRFVKRLKRM